MDQKKLKTRSGIGALISLACCFGLLNVLFGVLGLTAALAVLNQYGDYLFFPLYAFFATLFVWSLLRGDKGARQRAKSVTNKNWITYLVSLITVGVGLYFMVFGVTYALLIISGVIVGGLWLKVKNG